MSKEQQQQSSIPPELVEVLRQMTEINKITLEEKQRAAQEREQKQQQEASQTLKRIDAEIQAAKEQNEQRKLQRESCPHQIMNPANGNKRSAWRAQVNSDNCFVPVCCLCFTIMPKVKATVEQIKEGVGLDKYIELPMKALEKWHQASFPEGCDRESCYVCYPVMDDVAVYGESWNKKSQLLRRQ